ncbi:MAG: TolC family protein [Elainellaceae cyanobacterium]
MQAHRNVIVIGITTAVLLGPIVPANAQSHGSTVIGSAATGASKPLAQKPRSRLDEPRPDLTTYEVSPERIEVTESSDTVHRLASSQTSLTVAQVDSDASRDENIEEDIDESGVEDELDAADGADLESVSDFLDQDPASDADVPAPSDPLSQPLDLDNEGELDASPSSSDEETDAEADVESDTEVEAEGDIEAEEAPSALVQDVLEALRAPANPLFFPTNPETLELTETVPITLEQALQVSYRNSRELQTAQLQLEQSQAALREAQAQRLPTLSGNTSYTRSSVNQFRQEAGDSPFFQGGNSSETSNAATGTLSLNYDLFTSGQRQSSIRAAREAKRLQELQLEVVAEEIQLNVTQAYYDIQEADETVRINRDNLNEALISFRDAEARERAGVGTRFDRLQAQVEVANARQNLRNSISNQLISQRQLVEILSLPPSVNLTAADPVDLAGRWQLSLAESLTLAYKNRAELEQQLVQRELNRQQQRAARANTLPQLSLSAQYQVQDLLDETRAISGGDQDSFSIGAQLDWLFFDGGASRARARQEGLDIEIAETDFADTRESIRFEVEQAFFNIESNLENIQTARAAVQLAEESLRLARLRFQAGVGIQSDVIQAQTDLTEAEANLVNAVLGYNRALVAVKRAVSNLPDNNLSDIPPGNI